MESVLNQVMFIGVISTIFLPLIPLCYFLVEAVLGKKVEEVGVTRRARAFSLIYLVSSYVTILAWILAGSQNAKWHFASLYQHHDVSIHLTLFFDVNSAVFLGVTSIISNVIVFFSRRYLHRDPGFRRFYSILFLFIFGVSLLYCAGSFDFLFAAWEVVGISSFLLIAFYWHRPQAVVNAKRAYFTYRVFDVGLLLSAIFAQHVWHNPDLFYELSSGALIYPFLALPSWEKWLMSGLILLPVIGKSAQFPVSFWLPKAMEGPTPSSAIFYGSISIHAGVFLLLRTSSIWYHTNYFPIVLAMVGMITAVTATLFGRVQASIKGQIGYASIAQVGLMLVELAFGLWTLVLIHFVGNASLRCFQLLISSTIITQQLQIHSTLEGRTVSNRWSMENWFPERIRTSLYLFALNEGFLEAFVMNYLVYPIIQLAKWVDSILNKVGRSTRVSLSQNKSTETSLHSWLLVPLFASLLVLPKVSGPMVLMICTLFITLAILFSLAALSPNGTPIRVINLVFVSHCFATLSLMENGFELKGPSLLYGFGLVTSYLLVYVSYRHVLTQRTFDPRKRFAGLFSQFPVAFGVAFVGVLGLIGFPIATTFFGEDILLEYAVKTGVTYVALFCIIFIVNGITVIRTHSRLFFGERDVHVEFNMDMGPLKAMSLLLIFFTTNVVVFVNL